MNCGMEAIMAYFKYECRHLLRRTDEKQKNPLDALSRVRLHCTVPTIPHVQEYWRRAYWHRPFCVI